MTKKITAVCITLFFVLGLVMAAIPDAEGATAASTYIKRYNANYPAYVQHELPIVKAFQAQNDGSLGNQIVARAIWYMENGYMIYGHSKYPATGFIDCSNFVSLVYKDFGYQITSAARNYSTVGTKVNGVYSRRQTGSSKYTLVGTENLKPGDIFTFWKTDSSGNRYIGHVAIYMGKINGKPAIIQTVSGRPTAIGITDSFSYWYGEHFAGARRVLSTSQQTMLLKSIPAPVIPQVYQLPPQKPVVMP